MRVFSNFTDNGFNTQLLKEGARFVSPSSQQAAQ